MGNSIKVWSRSPLALTRVEPLEEIYRTMESQEGPESHYTYVYLHQLHSIRQWEISQWCYLIQEDNPPCRSVDNIQLCCLHIHDNVFEYKN